VSYDCCSCAALDESCIFCTCYHLQAAALIQYSAVTLLTFCYADLLQELACEYGFSFDILTADLDERSIGDRASSPEQLVTLLARAKADALKPQLEARAPKEKPKFLITCDQVVVHEGRILEKPQNAAEVGHSQSFLA
jgi:septum formation protein